ncbi:hypothetical protein [Salinispora vitiensis]|uniref:hypothetical protein n=1 Tax=Salinispora vitiensis TaxID=999544 RepID=UPI000378F32B|nr:hypothetical protein [Salinispora vitiensis]
MSDDLRDEIVGILGQPDVDATHRADLILSAVADWLGSPVGCDVRLSLALDAAAPGVFGHGVWADAGLTDAALAVARELAAAIRPPDPSGPRPALADRYAELPSGGAS